MPSDTVGSVRSVALPEGGAGISDAPAGIDVASGSRVGVVVEGLIGEVLVPMGGAGIGTAAGAG